jgi:hypothetical protein
MSLLNKTTLAATRFNDPKLHIRLYYQYSDADVKESFWDQSIGWNLRGDGSTVVAKINSPIAVVSWAGGTQVNNLSPISTELLISTSGSDTSILSRR